MKAPRPMTIAEVARVLGWTHDRTSRTLHKLNEETHGLLLRNLGGKGRGARWTVTLVALKKAAPEWFGNVRDNDERLDELEEKVADLDRRQNMSASAIGAVVRRLEKAHVA